MAQISQELPGDLHRSIKHYAVDEDIHQREAIIELLKAGLEATDEPV